MAEKDTPPGTGAAPPAEGTPWRPKFNPWLIAAVVSLAAFMEFLDTSIANVALPYIAGTLGASNDESTWVLTAYLASNAVVLPISGWFAGFFGRKRFFIICVLLFTMSSLLCGIAPNLGAIIVFRVLQGAGGGGMQPMCQAILADTFPPRQRGLAFALFGIVAVVGPTIGPTLGGWITDNYSWRWIFFINVPVGILALFLLYRLVEDPPWAKRGAMVIRNFDYIGIGLLAVGIGALQAMLDKGQEDDWFGSQFIVTLFITTVVCLSALVIWEWFHESPAVDIRLFKNFNFASSNLMIFVFGIVLFAALVMMPQYLQTVLGYTATLAGLVLTAGGFLVLVAMPVVGQLSSRVQARYLIALGWLLLAVAMFYTTREWNTGLSFRSASFLRVVQVAGLGFLFVPISLASYVGMPPEKSNNVAGLLNFSRNIGSSIGTSMVTTFIARRSQVHQTYLTNHVTQAGLNFPQAVDALARRLNVAGLEANLAQQQAYGRLYRATIAQATTLAYIDVFMILGVTSVVMFLLSFALKKNEPGGGGGAAVG